MAELGVARLSVQLPETPGSARFWYAVGTLVGRLSVLSTLKRPTPEVQNTVTGSNPFSPKIPILILPNPKT